MAPCDGKYMQLYFTLTEEDMHETASKPWESINILLQNTKDRHHSNEEL